MTRSESLLEKLRKSGATLPEDILIVFSFNLKNDNRFKSVDGVGVVDKEKVLIFENGENTDTLILDDVEEMVMTNLVGAYRVSAKLKSGDIRHIFCGDMHTHNEASRAVGYINGIIRDPEGAVPTEIVAVCPKCGKTLKREGEVCMRCASKVKSVRRLWSLTKGVRKFIVISMILFFAMTGLNIFAPMVQKYFVDEMIEAEVPPALTAFIGVLMGMVAIALVSHFISMARSYFMTIAGMDVVVKLRQLVFEKIHALSLSGVTKRPTGELIGRVTGDSMVIQRFLVNDLSMMLEQIILLLCISAIVIAYDWRLALLVVVPMPFVGLFYRLFWTFMRRMWHKQWVFERRSSTILYDTYQGIRVVKSFGMENREIDRYNEAVDEQGSVSIKNERMFAVINPILTVVAGVGEFFLLYYVGGQILDGKMTFGDMAQFSTYVSMMYGPLRWMVMIPRRMVHALTSVVKVFEIIDEDTDVPESENPVDKPIEGHVKFNDVSFGYLDGQTVVRHVNFEVKPGEMIGIVGKSGAGKSTLINLVMRLYDASSGSITLDGVDIRDISEEHLRSEMGVVLQETFLFSGTIFDNIAYAKPESTRDDVIRAAKAAGAHPFIMKLPDGYNTKVGEKGHTLSGGERQRIAIARALLHDPKILILDEATASLDTETESQLQEALKKLMEGRTTIAIAHRLSTLRNANRLIVVDNGTVAEEGSHDELMEKGGIYHDLVMAQRSMNKLHE